LQSCFFALQFTHKIPRQMLQLIGSKRILG